MTHRFRKHLLSRNKLGLLAALDSMTNEIMLLGVASLLLIMVQKNVAGLCCEFFPFFFRSLLSLSLSRLLPPLSPPPANKKKKKKLQNQSRRGRLQAPHLARLGGRLRLLPLAHRGRLRVLPEGQGLRRRRRHEGLLRAARREGKDVREPWVLGGGAGRRGAVGRRGRGEGARGGRGSLGRRRRRSAPPPAEPLRLGRSCFRSGGDGRDLRGKGRDRRRRVPAGEEAGRDRDGAPRGSR